MAAIDKRVSRQALLSDSSATERIWDEEGVG
jgi:hypothetical protein